MSRKSQPTIAICYDYDGTLIRGNMQENSFIPEIGMSKNDFWKEVKAHAKKHDMDEVLAYMHLMLKKAGDDHPFTQDALKKHGKKVELFEGVETWFNAIGDFAKQKAKLEHYIISSGLDEMIKGSPIGKKFSHIFASGFTYDAGGKAIFPARSINYTTKVQYLFRINKGVKNSWDNSEINKSTPESDRPIPFSQMIYIGDGDTDVPSMKMVNYKGGYSIAVYPAKSGKRKNKAESKKEQAVQELQKNNRVQFIAEANYSNNKDMYKIVTSLIDRIVNELEHKMNLNAK